MSILKALQRGIARRQKRGDSLQQIADSAGVGVGTLYRVYKGHVSPSVDVAEKIGKAVRVNISGELLPEE